MAYIGVLFVVALYAMRLFKYYIVLLLFQSACSDSLRVTAENIGSPERKIIPALSGERIKALSGLGYFDRAVTHNPEARNVTKAEGTAFDGWNVYGSRDRAQAFLMDNSGKVLHEWASADKRPPWMHVVLLPRGELIVLSKGNYLAKIDWNSKLIWKRSMPAHHDVTVAPDRKIYVLTHRMNEYNHGGVMVPIMDDSVEVLSPDGTLERKKSLFPLLRSLVPVSRLDRLAARKKQGVPTQKLISEGAPGDTTHTNSIQVLERAVPGIAEPGDILLSVREINRIVILDNKLERLRWSWGKGELEGQHHATHLDNGHILIFDNGVRRKQSRVIEMDPTTGKIVWSYTAAGFYSRLRGSAQKLPNGNVLTVESDKGHAVEVTMDGKQVWEFWNPDVRGEHDGKPTRSVIYRMMRYPKDFLAPGLTATAARD